MSSDKAAKAIATRLGRHAYRAPKLSQNGRPIVTGIQVFDQVIHFPVRLGQLVEIIGVSSAGKTQVLHSIAAEVLARSENAQAKLCWFDLNGGLDTDRLCHLIHRKQGLPGEPQRSERERLLSGLMLYHPQSTPALTLTLQSLPNYWASKEGAGGLFLLNLYGHHGRKYVCFTNTNTNIVSRHH